MKTDKLYCRALLRVPVHGHHPRRDIGEECRERSDVELVKGVPLCWVHRKAREIRRVRTSNGKTL